MSLATFLLGAKLSEKKKVIDAELDALFQSQSTEDSNDSPAEKRKKRRSDVRIVEPHKKRSKPSLPGVPSTSASPPGKQKKSSEKRVLIASKPISEHGFSDSEHPESLKRVSSDDSCSESSGEDENQDSTDLVHETIQKEKPSKPAARKGKYGPSDETKERRDARTIFIGNLAPDVVVKRPLQKQLHRHILSFVPTAKIESTRFRSVAFQTPTSKLPDTNDEVKKNKQPRQHERDRASSWRDIHTTDASKTDEKKFLTPSQKKKIAFINKDIHPDADSVHAYIVFDHPPPAHSRPANLPPPTPVMDPFEATRLAIEKCSGTMFLDHILRVDAVVKKSTTESSPESPLPNSIVGDPKLTVFVGNLDFASKEEDLRAFFEGVVSAERGPPASESGDKQKSWVTRVRIIRDKDTQLGKGFAYVQFADRACIDEILAFEHGKLKFAKRTLRVQRCKTIPSTSSVKNTPPKPATKPDHTPVPPIPKGDPSLGEKLAKLNKDERKRIKGADGDRVARRLAKKKARMVLAKQGVPVQNKQRQRTRKTSAAKKHGGMPAKNTSKGRVRSKKFVAKMNTKK